MKIQVASICKNEEDMIRPWLEHLLDSNYIEAIHIHDTGSTDATLDYIDSYKDDRIHLHRSLFFTNFSEARNTVLSKLKNPEWFIQLDIDELFNCNMDMGLELFEAKTKSWQSEGCLVWNVPHIKFFDFNRMWFHKPPTAPSWDGKEMIYSWQKDTITFYRGNLLGSSKYVNELHERFIVPTTQGANLSLIGKETLTDLSDLQDDFFVIHYSKAKLHAEAKRTGKSFEYCVGRKRREYRLIKPFVTNGKLYDREWALKATEADIEQLGKDQLVQFIDIEGHVFPEVSFDPYLLNNQFVRKYF